MNSRSLLALVVSPLLIPNTFLAWALVGGMSYGEMSLSMLFYGPIGYAIAIVFGIPLVLLFRRLGWRSPLFFILGGAVIGLLSAVLIKTVFGHVSDDRSYYLFWLVGCELMSLVAWTILYRFQRLSPDASTF